MKEFEIMQIKEFIKSMNKQQKILYYEQKKKKEWLAVILSLLIPGLGHIYVGEYEKGITIIFISIIMGTMTIFMIGISILNLFFCYILLAIIIYSTYDAYRLTEEYNKKLYMIIFNDKKTKKRR